MTPEQQREETLFAAALVKSPAERPAFLDGACHGDSALRARLDALLAEHEQPDELTPAVGPGGTLKIGHTTMLSTVTEQAGDLIGPYKLREKLGEGGCGVVYVAEQEKPVRRRVAFKVIKLGMDTRSVIARFGAERQALAMMDHPHIAKVLDAGATETGRPYFVMELVRGIRITDYCEQHHLSTKERLDLFIKVCHAIQHAHQKGIIHRDIKPSNILVTLHDGMPVPKVIDFGIAKATEGRLSDLTVYTEMHQFIGTPAYMSPEQAEMSGLDIDTRSDIYALGVLLYELLTGQTPFDATELVKSGIDEIRRTIREVEPPKPSTCLTQHLVAADVSPLKTSGGGKAGKVDSRRLLQEVRGDLDWIVMTCLEKDRTRRYETANGLATDVQRHLNNEPIHACPPSAAYRLQKWIRRNKLVFAASAAIAASLVIGITVSLWQAVRATQAESRTAAERDKKELARQDAEAISKFLTQVFQSPDPARDGRTITVAETLDKAAKKVETDLTTQPHRRARLQETLARTYHSLGLYREAMTLQEKVRDYALAKFGPDHPDTLKTMQSLALSYTDGGRVSEAIQLGEEVLAKQRKVLGPEHPDTLQTIGNLGVSYSIAGRRKDALKLREELLPMYRKVLGPEHPATLSALHNLANSYSHFGRTNEVLKLREEVLVLRRKVNGPEHPDTLRAMLTLSSSYADVGRKEESLKLREDALALSRKVLGPEHRDTLALIVELVKSHDETNPGQVLTLREEALAGYRKLNGPEDPSTLRAMHNLAVSYNQAGRLKEAIQLWEVSLPLMRKVLGPEDRDTLRALHQLGIACAAAGRHDKALLLDEELLQLRRKLLGPEDRETLGIMTNLAIDYNKTGRLNEAMTLQEAALTIKRRVLPPGDDYLSVALDHMAELYERTGRKAEAIQLRKEALAGYHNVSDPNNSSKIHVMRRLAFSYDNAGRPEEATKMWEETVPLMRKERGSEHPDTLEAMTHLALLYSAAGRHDESLKLQEEVFKGRRKVLGPEHRDTLGAMTNLAASYDKTGRVQEAVTLQEQALAIKRRVLRPNDPYLAAALSHMAHLYEKTGRTEEAAALRKERAITRSDPLPPVIATLVAPDSEWKWLHPTDGVDPVASQPNFHATFFTPGYDDSAWKSGRDSADPNGGFGYGPGFHGVDIGLPPDENHRHSAYFRLRFTTDKPHARLELRCQRDDAIIVYLDGVEVLRDNLPAGPEAYLLSATIPQRSDNDGVVHRFPILGTLVPGQHILAISVHNTELPSSDLRLGGITLVETAEDPEPLQGSKKNTSPAASR